MSHWYPISSMRRLRMKVRVRWGWVEPFEAVLMEARPRRWATIRDGVVEYLPPRKQRIWRDTSAGETVEVSERWLEQRGWGPEPTAWQPIGPWPDPLPEPLPSLPGPATAEPRMATIGGVEFCAATAAAEMEADRVAARAAPRQEAARDTWWLDPGRIVYQPAGHVTREMAEGRILRALLWCGYGQDVSRDVVPASRFLAEMASMTLSEALAANEEWATDRTLRPLKRDHDDFLEAMRWFCALNPAPRERGKKAWKLNKGQSLLLCCASRRPLLASDIARRIGVHQTYVPRLLNRTLDDVHKIANAPAATSAAVLALRDRNRKAKRDALAS